MMKLAAVILCAATLTPSAAHAQAMQEQEAHQLDIIRSATWAGDCGFISDSWANMLTNDAIEHVQLAAEQQWPSATGNNPTFDARQEVGSFGNQVDTLTIDGPLPSRRQCQQLKANGTMATLDGLMAQIQARRAALAD